MSVSHPSVPGESEAFTVLRRMFDEGFATGEASVVDQLCART